MPQPQPQDYPAFNQAYIATVYDEDILHALRQQTAFLHGFLAALPADKQTFAYAPGKWTVKQMLQHIIDTERILSYRFLCFARGEQQSLPGFEEDDYAGNATAAHRNWNELLEEFFAVRQATTSLVGSLTPEAWKRAGTANGKHITVNALAYVMVGHVNHHVGVLREKYGIS